jgi:hypothetical protein
MSDPFPSILQQLAGTMAFLSSIALAYTLVTGRWLLATPHLAHAEDRTGHRVGVFRLACLTAGFGLVAVAVPERLFAPVLGLSIFVPALLAALVTGRFDWEADDRRIATPATFWRWVAFHGAIIAIFAALLVVNLT